MKLIYAKSPKWANQNKTIIDLVVRFEEIDEDLPFTANPKDVEPHGRDIYARAIAGEFGEIADYTPPSRDQVASMVRYDRNQKLADTDWTQLPDVPSSIKSLWSPYRQSLRDISSQASFPYDIEWPTPPVKE
jgi:hypothetical protein